MTETTKGAGLHEIKPPEDPRPEKVRGLLEHCLTLGFVEAVVIGIYPRGEGFSTLGGHGMDPARLIGCLEIAKADLIRAMQVTRTATDIPEPPKPDKPA